ncbi:arsenosugar biosynthesis radical SAM (seleno)protein ArsS [Campylobacter sputorum]|uniref:arsenosugar biosynthesis radical SAM (seleno)protein ArsS n=1 Tax=Campylobacter sputorum TaxID=206 RepID=UPI001E473F5C|nr:arsenosugar biosynthesis radical SAM (seleno)protein ArsS [Campylobacter sputorum]
MRADEFLKSDLSVDKFKIMQVNLGNLCNLVCHHCHVEANPKSVNTMDKKTADLVIKTFKENNFQTLDLTGGAPEMNDNFIYIIENLKNFAKKIIVRTNLTILDTKEYEHLPEFYAQNNITLIASLPCYTKENVDKQRGNGVFQKSIKILKKLNSLGYGKNLELNLVYNPGGAFLPGNQNELEKNYKKTLLENYGIVFSHLFTITNMPIGRFKNELEKNGKLDEYMRLLENNFNETNISNLMCKNQISVGFDGKIYNCDFNQMLGLCLNENLQNISKVSNKIILKQHCLGCVAGAGSSCGGVLEK